MAKKPAPTTTELKRGTAREKKPRTLRISDDGWSALEAEAEARGLAGARGVLDAYVTRLERKHGRA